MSKKIRFHSLWALVLLPSLANAASSQVRQERRVVTVDAKGVPAEAPRGARRSLARASPGASGESPAWPGALPEIGGLENNARFPGPRAGDHEVRSKIWSPLPGISGERLHGKLGMRPDGSCCRFPQAPRVELEALSEAELHEAHRGFAFNARVSESTDVDRTQSDKRSRKCIERHKQYPADLPDASVIITMHNEHFATLIRTVHSILNTSPPRYLREIIIVDDASEPLPDLFDRERWEKLQAPLEEYIQGLPKVRLVRLAKQRGLMVARMEGIWRAEGAVVVSVDSHVEATPGWLEPLLTRIKEDRKRVALPRIDTIHFDTFDYHTDGGVSLMGTTWGLGEVVHGASGSDEPEPSIIMAGSIFAADRAYFLHFGGFDTNMTTWGGEEIEIGLRTWQCGGSMEFNPCSHVGHMFRNFKHWQGQPYKRTEEEIRINKHRIAEVWMDDYKGLYHLSSRPLSPGSSIGSLEARQELRRKLGCRSFSWFLEHMREVVPQMPMYVPKLTAASNMGALTNPHFQACVDTLGPDKSLGKPGAREGDDELVGISPCTGMHGQQAFLDEGAGIVRTASSSFSQCLGTSASKNFILVPCAGSAESLFMWDAARHRLQAGSRGCLTATSSNTAVLAPCDEGSVGQQWQWVGSP